MEQNINQLKNNLNEIKKTNFIEELKVERNDYINVSRDYKVPKFTSFITIIKEFGYDINNFYNVEENILLKNKNIVDDLCECTDDHTVSDKNRTIHYKYRSM